MFTSLSLVDFIRRRGTLLFVSALLVACDVPAEAGNLSRGSSVSFSSSASGSAANAATSQTSTAATTAAAQSAQAALTANRAQVSLMRSLTAFQNSLAAQKAAHLAAVNNFSNNLTSQTTVINGLTAGGLNPLGGLPATTSNSSIQVVDLGGSGKNQLALSNGGSLTLPTGTAGSDQISISGAGSVSTTSGTVTATAGSLVTVTGGTLAAANGGSITLTAGSGTLTATTSVKITPTLPFSVTPPGGGTPTTYQAGQTANLLPGATVTLTGSGTGTVAVTGSGTVTLAGAGTLALANPATGVGGTISASTGTTSFTNGAVSSLASGSTVNISGSGTIQFSGTGNDVLPVIVQPNTAQTLPAFTTTGSVETTASYNLPSTWSGVGALSQSVINGQTMVASSSTGSKTVTLASSTLPTGFGVGSILLGSPVVSISGNTVTLAGNANANVSNNNAAFVGDNTTVTITQDQSQALLYWQTFNIGKNTTLDFDQSAGGANVGDWVAINRILDPTLNPSQIFGAIQSSGQVYVINQNGIIFNGSSQVNTHALVASTLPINSNLVASGLLNNPGGEFLFTSVETDPIQGSTGATSYNPNADYYDSNNDSNTLQNATSGSISVQAGASLTSPGSPEGIGGKIALIAPQIDNEGTLSSPDGQVILAAGQQVGFAPHPSSDASLRGLDIAVGAGSTLAYDSTPGASNTGVDYAMNGPNGYIDAPEADVTMTGYNVLQMGAISGVTSVAFNGRIDLLALNNLTPTALPPSSPIFAAIPGTVNAGLVYLGANSLTGVLPDYSSADTQVGSSLALPSEVYVEGANLHMAGGTTLNSNQFYGAQLIAPNATVTLSLGYVNTTIAAPAAKFAADTPPLPENVGLDPTNSNNTGAEPEAALSSPAEVIFDPGTNVDVSGSNVQASVAENIVSAQLTQAILENSTLQETGPLRGQTVKVDISLTGTNPDGSIWYGSPIGDLSGYANLVEHTVGELTIAGGTVAINTNGPVLFNSASANNSTISSTINVSGGSIDYQGSMVQTSEVITATGSLLNISQATPNQVYQGLENGLLISSSKWGTSQSYNDAQNSGTYFDPGYVTGGNGGSLAIAASTNASTIPLLNGTFLGNTTMGLRQQSTPPTPGTFNFSIQTPAGGTAPPNVNIVIQPSRDPQPSVQNTIYFSPDLFGADGFSNVTLNSEGGLITIPSDAVVSTLPGGAFNLTGQNVDIYGQIDVPSGSVSITAEPKDPVDLTLGNAAPYDPTLGNVELFSNGVISATGLTFDETSSTPGTLPFRVNGGSIKINSAATLLDANSLIDASGGIARSSANKIYNGKGGSISISGTYNGSDTNTDGRVALNGAISAYGIGQGGSLTLKAPAVQVGGSVQNYQGSATPLLLPATFFSQGGFSNFSLSGEVGVQILTAVSPVLTQEIADENGAQFGTQLISSSQLPQSPAAPVNLTFSAPGSPYYIGTLNLGVGGNIITAPTSSVSLNGQLVDILGQVTAAGGTITITGDSTANLNGQTVGPPEVSVYLGNQSRLDTSGVVISAITNSASQVITTGQVLPGGSISITGNIVGEVGSSLVANGAQGTLDVPASNTVVGSQGISSGRSTPYVLETLGSNGGSITLTAYEELFDGGSLSSMPGNQSAIGGTLTIGSGLAGTVAVPPATGNPDLFISQSGALVPGGASLGDLLSGTYQGGGGYFTVDQFAAGGFGSLILNGIVQFQTSVTIKASQEVEIGPNNGIGTVFANASASPAISITAPYISIGSSTLSIEGQTLSNDAPSYVQIGSSSSPILNLSPEPGLAYPAYGSATLSLNATDLIDVGYLSLQNFKSAAFDVSQGDIRGGGLFYAAGTINLTAGQIYTPTAATFTVAAFDSAPGALDGTININGNGVTRDLPLSAGGTINIYATTINQNGVLEAPFGVINLGALPDTTTGLPPVLAGINVVFDSTTQTDQNTPDYNEYAPLTSKLTLGPDSITSVSGVSSTGQALDLPYGTILNGGNWIAPNGKDITAGGLPGKAVNLEGAMVDDMSGSLVDLTGGGNLYAYQFNPGVGGTNDILNIYKYANGAVMTTSSGVPVSSSSFAIVPSYGINYAPIDLTVAEDQSQTSVDYPYANSNLTSQIGNQIYLAGGAGLSAGTYTVLPARYALLPGAFLVTPSQGAVTVQTTTNPDGSLEMAGYLYNNLNPNQQIVPSVSGFEVDSSSVVHARAEYDISQANTFLAASAIANNQPVPRLPVDAGQLVFDATNTLDLQGKLSGHAGAGGLGSTVDIGSPDDIYIVSNDGDTPALTIPAGTNPADYSYLVLSARQLNDFGAGSLLVGGIRSSTSGATTIDPTTNSVFVQNDANSALNGNEIILVSKGTLDLAPGADVQQSGVVSSGAQDLVISSNGGSVPLSFSYSLTSGNSLDLNAGSSLTLPGGTPGSDLVTSTSGGLITTLSGTITAFQANTPLSIAAGDTITLTSNGTIGLSGGTTPLPLISSLTTGSSFSVNQTATVVLPGGTLGNDMVSSSSGGSYTSNGVTTTFVANTPFAVPAGASLSLTNKGTISFASGNGTGVPLSLVSSLSSGNSIALNAGLPVTLPSGTPGSDMITSTSAGNITVGGTLTPFQANTPFALPAGGIVTLTNNGTLSFSSGTGGSIPLIEGAFTSGNSVALTAGSSVTLPSGTPSDDRVTSTSAGSYQVGNVVTTFQANTPVAVPANATISLTNNGTLSFSTVSADGALLRVTGDPNATFTRQGIDYSDTAPQLTIGANVSIGGVAVTLDSSSGAVIDPTATLDQGKVGQSVILRSGAISLQIDPGVSLTSAPGLVISNSTLQTLQSSVASLTLSSYSTVNFYGAGTLGSVSNGQPVVRNLTIEGAGILGYGVNGGTVTINAQNVSIDNSANESLPISLPFLPTGAQTNSLVINADTINLGANAFATDGYSTTGLIASNEMLVNGTGGFNAQGGLNLTTTMITATTSGANYAFDAQGGDFDLVQPSVLGTASVTGGLGSTISFTGSNVNLGSAVSAPSGTINVQATTGNIEVKSGGKISATGQAVTFGSVTDYTNGGQINLTATNGTVTLDAGGVVNVSAQTGGGNAGAVWVSTGGTLTVADKTLQGTAGAGGVGGKFNAQLGQESALSGVTTPLTDGGFDSLAFDVLDGSVTVDGAVGSALGTTGITSFSLTAEQGAITVDNTINASGVNGGTIDLYANQHVTLLSPTSGVAGSGAVLSVEGQQFNSAGQGGLVDIETRGAGTKGIDIQTGSSINLSVDYLPVLLPESPSTQTGNSLTLSQAGSFVLPHGTPGNDQLELSAGGTFIAPGGVATPFAANQPLPSLAAGTVITLSGPGSVTFLSGGTGGSVPIWLSSSASFTSSGATNLSGSAALTAAAADDSSGVLHLRAPTTSNNTNLQIGAIKGNIVGASTVEVEGYNTYTPSNGTITSALEGSAATSAPDDGTVYGDAEGFANNTAAILSGLLSGTPNASQSSLYQIIPGAEIINPSASANQGNLTLAGNWDLSSFRFGPGNVAGDLTLRAVNNLVFTGSLTDGFAPTNPYLASSNVTQNSSTVGVINTTGLGLGELIAGFGIPQGDTISSILNTPIASTSFSAGDQTITVGSTAGLQLGEILVGAGIPTGDVITGITGTTISLATAATKTESNETVTAEGITLAQNATISGTESVAALEFPLASSNVTQNSTTVGLINTAGLVVGEPLTGTGIPAGDTISSILNTPIASTSFSSGSQTITVGSVSKLVVGEVLVGAGIPTGDAITKITGTTLTLSAKTTAAESNETVTAEGVNLAVKATASGKVSLTTSPYTWNVLPVASWSYRLVAGANFTSTNASTANFGSVQTLTQLGLNNNSLTNGSLEAGSLLLGQNIPAGTTYGTKTATIASTYAQLIRTGTGSITIDTGGSVDLLNQLATIYTAGSLAPAISGFDSPTGTSDSSYESHVYGTNISPAPQSAAQYTQGGGNITIDAQQDIAHLTVNSAGALVPDTSWQFPTNWLYRRGATSSTDVFDKTKLNANVTASTTWWIDFTNFFEGIGALGGGNVNLSAGGNIVNVDAAVPTNARMPYADAANNPLPDVAGNLVELGGGDLSIVAGGAIEGGTYYVEQGLGTIQAGTITSAGDTARISAGDVFLKEYTPLPLTLFVGDSSFTVEATNGLTMGSTVNPFLMPQGIGNNFNNESFFSTYASDSAVNLSSLLGSIQIQGSETSGQGLQGSLADAYLSAASPGGIPSNFGAEQSRDLSPWTLTLDPTSVQTSFIDNVSDYSTFYAFSPPVFSAAAFTGNIQYLSDQTLAPSSRGTLQLLAAGSIEGAFNAASVGNGVTASITILDNDPGKLPSVVNPFGLGKSTTDPANNPSIGFYINNVDALLGETPSYANESVPTLESYHTQGLLHDNTTLPVEIATIGGDIADFTLISPEQTRISSGLDLQDVSLYLQNNNPGDISVVAANRDITLYDPESTGLINLDAANSSFLTAGDIQIGGPGTLEVLAGRNLNLGEGTPPQVASGNLSAVGTGLGITSIGQARNPYLPFGGANIIAGAGFGDPSSLGDSTLDFGNVNLSMGAVTPDNSLDYGSSFIGEFLDPGSTESSIYLPDLGTLMGLSGTTANPQIWSAFAGESKEQQDAQATAIFYDVLRDAGRDHNNPNSPDVGTYKEGYAAIEALFPASHTYQGDISSSSREIKTTNDGDINLLVPGGGIDVGLNNLGTQAVDQGILTVDGGNISIFTHNDVAIGTSRIFTLHGGNIIIWSSVGNIDAGASSRTVQSAPPTRVLVDLGSADVQTDLAGLATGGGIGVLETVVGSPPGNVDLIAPVGTVNAGDAGIRSSGNINVAAAQVLNAGNIQAGGASTGVPTSSVPNIGATVAASSAAGSSQNAASQVSARQQPSQTLPIQVPSIISVEVIGYGGGDDDSAYYSPTNNPAF